MTVEIILIIIVFAIIGGVMYLNLEQDKAKDVEKMKIKFT